MPKKLYQVRMKNGDVYEIRADDREEAKETAKRLWRKRRTSEPVIESVNP